VERWFGDVYRGGGEESKCEWWFSFPFLIALAWLLKGKGRNRTQGRDDPQKIVRREQRNSKNVVNKVCCALIDLVGFFLFYFRRLAAGGVFWRHLVGTKKKRLSAEMAKQRNWDARDGDGGK